MTHLDCAQSSEKLTGGHKTNKSTKQSLKKASILNRTMPPNCVDKEKKKSIWRRRDRTSSGEKVDIKKRTL